VARPPADISGRVFIIFIDDLHLQALLTPRVKDLLREIKETLLHDGDLIAIVSSGPSSIEIHQTYDLNRVDEAKRRVMGAGQTPKEIIMMPQTNEGPRQIRYNVAVAFGVCYDMLMQLEKVNNRRKAFIYISSGYDFNPFQNGRLKWEQEQFGTNNRDTDGKTGYEIDHPGDMNPFLRQGQQFAESDLVAELAELTRAANRANTSFYTIDPRGLMSNVADISEDLTSEDWRAFTQVSQSSLRVLADETGGIAVVNQNDFKKALQEIDNATSDYYILGYYSSNPDPLRKKRSIEVRVTRPGVHLAPYRQVYTLQPPTTRPIKKN
jgi:VWFA-related protein